MLIAATPLAAVPAPAQNPTGPAPTGAVPNGAVPGGPPSSVRAFTLDMGRPAVAPVPASASAQAFPANAPPAEGQTPSPAPSEQAEQGAGTEDGEGDLSTAEGIPIPTPASPAVIPAGGGSAFAAGGMGKGMSESGISGSGISGVGGLGPVAAGPDALGMGAAAPDTTTLGTAAPDMTAFEAALPDAANPDAAINMADMQAEALAAEVPVVEAALSPDRADIAPSAPPPPRAEGGTVERPPELLRQQAEAVVHASLDGMRDKAAEDQGRIQITLQREGDEWRVTVSADNPETLDLMRRHSDQLQQDLARQGFAGAQIDFSDWRDEGEGGGSESPQLAGQPAPSARYIHTPQSPASGLDLRL